MQVEDFREREIIDHFARVVRAGDFFVNELEKFDSSTDSSDIEDIENNRRLIELQRRYQLILQSIPDPEPVILPEYTISVTAGEGGDASGGGTYEEGDQVSLTATADAGYLFKEWTENGDPVSTDNPYVFNAEEDRSITATFEQE